MEMFDLDGNEQQARGDREQAGRPGEFGGRDRHLAPPSGGSRGGRRAVAVPIRFHSDQPSDKNSAWDSGSSWRRRNACIRSFTWPPSPAPAAANCSTVLADVDLVGGAVVVTGSASVVEGK